LSAKSFARIAAKSFAGLTEIKMFTGLFERFFPGAKRFIVPW
jgi:hypothetical protein